jgi:hypothetical protein
MIAAQYLGDANHLTSASTLMLNVYDASIKLELSTTSLTYPGAANVTACVIPATAATATGTVRIYDETTLLTTLKLQGNGCGYWYVSPGLSAGTHVLTAVYLGDKNNPAGTSASVTVTVAPVPVKMGVSCLNTLFAYGADYECTVNLSSGGGSPLGSIGYSFDGGSPEAVPLEYGNAQFSIAKPSVGTHTVTVSYAQQGNYAVAASQSKTSTVTAAPVEVLLAPSVWYATAGTSITFQAVVASWSAGPPSSTGDVSFYDGSTLLAAVPVDASGRASYTTAGLSSGIHTITATYGGGTNYGTGSSHVSITIVK